jgi:hypothetical protein
MSLTFVLIAMIFCHIADDFYLQGVLASMKQKSWWHGKIPEDKEEEFYQDDYLMALAAHCTSWATMMMLPIAIYEGFGIGMWFLLVWAINICVHFVIDNAKANKHSINLVTDQLCHLMQILITFTVFYFLNLYNIIM